MHISKSAYPVSITAFNEGMKPIAGAEVSINGTLKGRTNQYGRLMLSDIPAGTYAIAVKAPGYGDWNEVCHISGEGEDIVAELDYDRASVTISVEDTDRKAVADAAIQVDGQAAGVTDGLGCLRMALTTDRAITAACEVMSLSTSRSRSAQANGPARGGRTSNPGSSSAPLSSQPSSGPSLWCGVRAGRWAGRHVVGTAVGTAPPQEAISPSGRGALFEQKSVL